MEIFFSDNIEGNICRLGKDESAHCVRVLRHRAGDEITVIDGRGSMYRCRLTDDDSTAAEAMVIERTKGWGGHPYYLELAVCPTKNPDRNEGMMEKATEVGVDRFAPIIGEHSERRIFKTERAHKILLSATKQSLKGTIPEIEEPVSVKEFILAHKESKALKMIAYCFEGDGYERTSIKQALNSFNGNEICVMIGPEGDFSKEEAELAISCGFIPVHLGESRLRTETAGLTACEAVYFHFMK